ncbi:MAG TPA: DEDD exonuclease domain-containing protein [Sporichthyaceae bacterium]|jgi:DNA polymerase-3 subunit epsilon
MIPTLNSLNRLGSENARSSQLSLRSPQSAVQATFDELGVPLREVTFVVVDLETTGSSAADGITEIGAVKVRGGERLGEFATLVNPGSPIPAFISVLTGITDSMVAGAPRIDAALAAFLEFAAGSVLVAHNAPFDVGFLKAACARSGREWPGYTVVDTVRLARRVVTRDEAPNCKLGTLARVFRSATTPNHRALDDARATVDVLHGLLERVGAMGVQSLEELTTFSAKVRAAQRRKRFLADGLPCAPGVYRFEDARGEVLYVGTSGNIRDRVRSYFTASESRARMGEMVAIAERVVPIVCATRLEAQVRELRLIAEHKPKYNRRSRFPERAVWLKLTDEAFPRLSLVRQVRADAATYLGPFSSSRQAEEAMTAAHEAFPLRQCREPLSPRKQRPACALAEMGRCNAPCEGRESVAEYATHVEAARAAMQCDGREIVARLHARIQRLADATRYEEAAVHRDRLAAFTRAAARLQRLQGLTGCPEMVAARALPTGGWEIAVVRYGRLAAAAVAESTRTVLAEVDAAVATAATVLPGVGPLPAALAEETECILRWLEQPGTRLVSLEGTWSSPTHGAGRWRDHPATA